MNFRKNSEGERIPASQPFQSGDSETLQQRRDSFEELKTQLHQKLVERLNLAALANLDQALLRAQIREITEILVAEENIFLSQENKERLINEIQNETLGLGPIERYTHDQDISDILVNTHGQVYIEKNGKLMLTETKFKSDSHVMLIIDRILSKVGRRVDESSPMADARLPDGSRVNAVIPPIAIDGPMLSIRKFRTDVLSMNDLLKNNSISMPMLQFLQGAVKSRLNIIISGGTGAGKTTLLNILSGYIPTEERIITIEDSAELKLQQPHVIRLETRPANIEGRGTVEQRDLVRNALRMRPNRIIIGEVRGAEIYDMLQAMNTGHDGSLTTVHANSSRDVLLRLETLMLLAGIEIREKAIRQLISSAIDIVIQINRFSDGSRKISSISEIVGMEHDTITMQEIFKFDRTGVGEEGEVIGQYRATGIRPRSLDRILSSGVKLQTDVFNL
ncbi:MAG TPA: CpaF family protein [candidate division Zixibacteria bacterium]|nr:CpaF family protein [candidate division Zixibacteria bacterium]HEQ97721.1 CpaF family protein [candidate division Zixibacteria bacterium]